MDRDNNIDRTRRAVDAIARGAQSSSTTDIVSAIEQSYKQNISDEFIEPIVLDPQYPGVHPDDVLFFFNFRSDRMKQLVSGLHRDLPQNTIYTMTQYDASYSFPVLFEKESIDNTLGEILSKLGHTQLRATESEKFPHVTYFFNGGVEVVFDGELRSLAESNKVKHDEMPHMKAEEIHQNV
ncbi:2,3-bisphosphoglycerate-independent phosphoglycerate mutase, partial [Candidatus Microgenomates bacterium]|nr:2,3-bisphosphoglycerate-independent phosphoglycerate mutase [Candidatus Microgenomates bacterium]